MRECPLATVVSIVDGQLAVSHVPLMACAGRDGYVSPSWYQNRESVPTWNYMVVHAEGPVTITHDSAAKERILKALIDVHDPARIANRRACAAMSSRTSASLLGAIRHCMRFRLTAARGEAGRFGCLGPRLLARRLLEQTGRRWRRDRHQRSAPHRVGGIGTDGLGRGAHLDVPLRQQDRQGRALGASRASRT